MLLQCPVLRDFPRRKTTQPSANATIRLVENPVKLPPDDEGRRDQHIGNWMSSSPTRLLACWSSQDWSHARRAMNKSQPADWRLRSDHWRTV